MFLKDYQKKTIDTIKQVVGNELLAVNDIILDAAKSQTELIPIICNYLVSAGGKRLRPILTLFFGHIFANTTKDKANIVKMAAAVEMIHTATLLHDDVVDNSASRRGNKTANIMWGNKPAILVGDYLLAKSFCLMVEAGSLKSLELLANSAKRITEAEVMQLDLLFKNDTTIEQYLELVEGKTAALFSAACAVVPALLGSPNKELDAIYNYGLYLGIAFQIVDDIMDYITSQSTSGKTVANDISEGKVTLPLILAFNSLDEQNKQRLVEIISLKPQIESKEAKEAYNIVCSTKAIHESYAYVNIYSKKASNAISELDDLISSENIALLHSLIEYNQARLV